jgi:outer membrane receptor protein involved in Fe transport
VNLGADYALSDKTTLGMNLTGGRFLLKRTIASRIYNFTMPYSSEFFKVTDDDMDFDLAYYSGSMNFTHNFKKEGDRLSAELVFAHTNGGVKQFFSEYYTDNLYQIADNSPALMKTDNSNHRNDFRLKADYSKAINDHSNLEAGAQMLVYSKTVDFVYNDFLGNEWLPNADYTNSMDFSRNIYNMYTVFSSKIKGFDYQLGVRGEYVKRSLFQKTMQINYAFEDLQIYPTVHISRQLPKDHQIMASYSRRISRPQDYWLNPFPDYSDSYYISRGNPSLKPEFTDSYELNYQKRFKKGSLSFSAYYRLTHDLMQRTEDLLDNRMILLTFSNLDNDEAMGFELSPSVDIGKWCKLSPVFNLYKYSINGNVAGYNVSNSVMTWNAQLMAIFQIGSSTKLQLSGNYNAKSLDTQGELMPMYMANLSLKQEFFKRSLVVSLQAMNIFKTGQYRITTNGEGFYSEISVIPDAPVFSIGLSYRINNFRKAVRPTDQPVLEQ